MFASYSKLQELGRQVNRGEKAIQILAPSPYKTKKEMDVLDQVTQTPILNPDGSVMKEEVEATIPSFRATSVFDISQTDGKPIPSLFDNLEGDVNGFSNFMKAMERVSPVPIIYEPMDDKDGYYDQINKRVALREDMSERQTVAAVIHEVSHAKLHNLDMDNIKESLKARGKDQKTMEVEAESIAYVVSQYYGVETGANSFGYIAMWSKNKELPELQASLEIIRNTASELIEDLDEILAELQKEQLLLDGNENRYGIYQMKENSEAREYLFMDMDFVERHGHAIQKEDYELVYSDLLQEEDTLDSLYEKFNINRPDDFYGHSLSVSDVVVLNKDGEVKAYYVDSISFKELADFLEKEQVIEPTELAYEINGQYFAIHEVDEGYDYTFYDKDFRDIDGGILDNPYLSIYEAADELIEDMEWKDSERIPMDYDEFQDLTDLAVMKVIASLKASHGEAYKPLAKVEELEEANYNMIDNVLNNQKPKKDTISLEYYAAVCDEFHDLGAYYESEHLEIIAEKYREIRKDPTNYYMGNGLGIIYHDSENPIYDGTELALIHADKICGNHLDDVSYMAAEPKVHEALERLRNLFPEFDYVPPKDIRESLYPQHMTTEELAETIVSFSSDYDTYHYQDVTEDDETALMEMVLELRSGNAYKLIPYFKDMVDEGGEAGIHAEVLLERLREYQPDVSENMEPIVKVDFCGDESISQNKYWKLSELDKTVEELDHTLSKNIDEKTGEARYVARLNFTIYYADGDAVKTLTDKINIGEGDGGLISNLINQNELKLSDQGWMDYQKMKGEESFNAYMAEMTDMQEKILPHLQSFCAIHERSTEKDEKSVASSEKGKVGAVLKEQKKASGEKPRKSIHERLQENKEIIAKKQGKEVKQRGVELA